MEIDFELQYVECSLADERIESKPRLRTYLDLHFERSETTGGIITTELDEHDLTKIYEGTLIGSVPRGAGIPATACIGLACYAQRRNENGVSEYTTAGFSYVRIGEVLDAMQRAKQYERICPLLMQTTRLMGEPLEKGKVLFRVTGVRVDRKTRIVPVDQCLMGTSVDRLGAVLNETIQKRVEFEASFPDTWPGVKNVRVPMSISDEGIALTQTCFVPIEGYVMDEPLTTNEGFFVNALERVLRRRNLDPATALDNMDLAHRAEVMAEICVFAAQSFTYFGDSYELHNRRTGQAYDAARMHVPFEHMQNMGVAFAGDCEDSAKFVMLVYLALCDFKAFTDKRLVKLQGIAKRYIFFLILATVHGAKAEDKTEHIGAHMYGLLIPRYHVMEALKRTPEGAKFEAAVQAVMDGDDKDDPLPTLFCEGTGKIRPLGTGPMVSLKHIVRSSLPSNHPGSYDPLYNERRYVAPMRFKAGMKTEIPHDMGADSPFYLGNMVAVTPAFLRLGFNLGSFICGKIGEGSEITRGVPFVDVVNQRSNMALVPMPTLPEPVMRITQEAVALRVPSRPLVLTLDAPFEKMHPELERLKRGVAAMGRTGTSPHGSVDVFMRPHQFNARTIDLALAEIQQLPRIYKVDYEAERITNQLKTWRLQLYVDK